MLHTDPPAERQDTNASRARDPFPLAALYRIARTVEPVSIIRIQHDEALVLHEDGRLAWHGLERLEVLEGREHPALAARLRAAAALTGKLRTAA